MRELSGAEKAAVLFLHLGEDTANLVFKGLSRREMRSLSAATRSVGDLEQAEIDAVLKTYISELGGTSMELRSGHAFISKLAKENLGKEKAKEFLGDDGAGLADTLADIDTRTISSLIRSEHPQTVALILAHLPAARAADVLRQLPEFLRGDALRRLANIDQVSPDIIDLVERALVAEVAQMGKAGMGRKVGGVNMVADVLNQLDKTQEEALMKDMEENDEDLAEEVRGLMFVFDDLIHLDAKGIQTLLKEVERDSLILALKACDDDLREHIFKNMSTRAVQMVQEDMENRGPVRLSDVETAQGDIVKVALALTQNGTIELQKGGAEEMV